MKIQHHLGKITWSFADKLLFVAYGFVTFYQIAHLAPAEYGIFILLFNISSYILNVSDSFALHPLIQFGTNENDRPKVNFITLILHSSIMLGLSLIIFLFYLLFERIFNEGNFVNIIWYLPIFALITIPRTYIQKLLVRDLDFKSVFFNNFIFFGVQSALTFYFVNGYNTLSTELMIEIYIIGSIFSSISALILSYKLLKFSKKGEITARKMLKFSVPMTVVAAIHSIPKMLDVHIIRIFFSAEVVGIYNSAKTLFRVFEQANDASYALIYPTAVKHKARNNKEELISLMTKAVSFLFMVYLFGFIILELGLTEYIIKLFGLNVKYFAAISMFNVMAFAALALPFTLLALIITASGDTAKVLRLVIISSVVSLIVFFITGLIGNANLIAFGVISYHLTLGILSYIEIQKEYKFPYSLIFRSFSDTYNFIKHKIKK